MRSNGLGAASAAPDSAAMPATSHATAGALDEAQHRLLALSSDLLSVISLGGDFRWVNPAWSALLGVPPHSLIGQSCFDFIHPDDHEATAAEAARLIAGGVATGFTNRYRVADGSYRLLHWSAAAAVGDLVYAIARDITEQRRVEAALHESERRYQTVIAALEEGVIVQDTEGRIITANPGVARILGLPADDLRDRRSTDFVWDAVREDGSPLPIDEMPARVALRSGKPQSSVVGIHRPNRPLLWLAVSAQPLARDGESAPYGVVTSLFDITARKLADDERERLRQRAEAAESRFRGLVESAPDAIISVGTDGRIALVNRQAELLFGYEREAMLGQPLELLVPERSRSRHTIHRAHYAADPDTRAMGCGRELAGRRRDGSEFPVEISLSSLGAGNDQLLTAVIRDVSQRKRDEDALRESEARFRSAYEYAAIGMSMVALDGRFLSVNRAICDLVGYTADELLAATFRAITHPDDLADDLGHVQRLLAGEITHFHLEKCYFHKRGHPVWVTLSVSLVRAGDGTPLYFVSQVQDITARKRAEEELRRSEERARALWAEADRQARELALLDQVRTALAHELDPATTFRTVVEAIARTFGYGHVGLYLRAGDELILQHQLGYEDPLERLPLTRGVCGRVARTGEAVLLEDVWADPDFVGTPGETYSEVCVPLVVEGQTIGILNIESTYGALLGPADLRLMEALAAQIGVTIGRARLYAALRESERDYRLLLDQAADGIFISDLTGRYLTVNARACSLTGFTREELLARGVADLIPADELSAAVRHWGDLQAESSGVVVAERRLLRKDGTSVPVEVSARLLPDGRLQEIARDITERKRAEAELRRRAFHDPLTDLPNRHPFADRLQQALARARRNAGHTFAVLCLDLDRFKQINDSLGHPAGDALLVETARRLEHCVREGDTVARLGGDEFAILLEDLQPDDAAEVAGRIQQAIARPFLLGENEVAVSTSIGIAPGATRYTEPAELLRDADIALYRSKEAGRARHVVFDEGMHTEAVALLQLENDLRRAVERQQFVLHYQPIVALDTGIPVGFEALIRWQHPRRGLIAPAEFIALAEETGLIVPLGRWVLGEACRQFATWRSHLSPGLDLTIGVNLSSRQFALPDLADQVAAALAESGLPARCLRLELTESTLMEQPTAGSATLSRLRALGVQVQVDDFGTGYSSLSYLQRFPLDALKIDRSFVVNLGSASESTAIIRAVVSLAQALGLQVVAEGVETAAQRADLRALNCAYGQGYHFAPALPADQALAFATNALAASLVTAAG